MLVAVGLILLKGALLVALARAFGFGARLAAELGAVLAQGSEFAFVLLALAATTGPLPAPAGRSPGRWRSR